MTAKHVIDYTTGPHHWLLLLSRALADGLVIVKQTDL